MRDAVIVDAVRSPMTKGNAARTGKPSGALCDLHPVELLGQTLKGLIDRNENAMLNGETIRLDGAIRMAPR